DPVRPGHRRTPGGEREDFCRRTQGSAPGAPRPARGGRRAGRCPARTGWSPMSTTRALVGAARTLVVKVGSSSLTTAGGGLDPVRLDALVDAVAARTAAGSHVV